MEMTPPATPGGEPGQEDDRAELYFIFPAGRGSLLAQKASRPVNILFFF